MSLARNVNLIEVLTYELGRCAVADDAAETITEQQIRQAFAAAAAALASSPAAPDPPPPPPPFLPAEPDPAAFRAWFPRAAQTAKDPAAASLRPLVLCFPPAGCGDDVYAWDPERNPLLAWCRKHGADLLCAQPPGRGARLRESAPPDLQAYAAAVAPLVARRVALAPWWAVVGHSLGAWAAVEVAAAVAGLQEQRQQQPGAAARPGEAPPPCCPPLRAAGPPMLLAVSAMPPPDWPADRRPWRAQRGLDDAAFADECRAWDVSAAVFEPNMWRLFVPCLRADFKLFDEYDHSRGGGGGEGGGGGGGDGEGGAGRRRLLAERACSARGEVLAMWGARDRRVTRAMVAAWEGWAAAAGSAAFTAGEVRGHHLWPLERRQRRAAAAPQTGVGGGGGTDGQEDDDEEDPRSVWMREVAAALQRAADKHHRSASTAATAANLQ